jgi:hypothetical protein
MTGSAAEHFLTGSWDEEVLLARAHDTGRAKCCLVLAGGEWKPDVLEFTLQTLESDVLDEISQPKAWHAITALAYALMEKGEMTGREIVSLLGKP